MLSENGPLGDKHSSGVAGTTTAYSQIRSRTVSKNRTSDSPGIYTEYRIGCAINGSFQLKAWHKSHINLCIKRVTETLPRLPLVRVNRKHRHFPNLHNQQRASKGSSDTLYKAKFLDSLPKGRVRSFVFLVSIFDLYAFLLLITTFYFYLISHNMAPALIGSCKKQWSFG